MIRPELMDALSKFNHEMGLVERSTWEDIHAHGGDREKVVAWFVPWATALLLLAASVDEDNSAEVSVVSDAFTRLLDVLEGLGIGFEEVADVTLMPPQSLN